MSTTKPVLLINGNPVGQVGGEGGSSGHTIIDPDGTAMTQESNLQFADSHVSDDSTNGRTVVENIKEHTTKADYDQATEDGFHVIDDGNDVPIGEIEEDVVSVTADGNKTYATLLDELYALIDSTKLTNNSYIDIFDGYFRLNDMSGGSYYFERAFSGAKLFDDTLQVSSSGSLIRSWETTTNGNTYSDSTSTQKPSNGTVITLHYGTSSTVINLKTSANYCQMGDGTTVQSKIESNDFGTFGTLASFESAIKDKLALMKNGDIARGVVLFSSSFAPFNLAGGFSFFIQSRADNSSNVGMIQVWNQLGAIHYGFCNGGTFTWKKPTLT